METNTDSELAIFHDFVVEQLRSGDPLLSSEQCVAAFRAWQRDVSRLRDALRPGLERAARGEAGEIDWDEFKQRGRERLSREGIRE